MSSGVTQRVGFLSEDERVVGVLHLPRHREVRETSIVITCHGLNSSKDSVKYLEIAEYFSSKGFAVLRFDFRGAGESEGTGNMLTDRIRDLNGAIGLAIEREFKSIGVLGSSFGGATAILTASQTREINAVVTWSTPCLLKDLFKSMIRTVRDRRDSHSSEDEGSIKSFESSPFMEDLSKYDVVDAARKISKILVIHSKRDQVVPWNQANMIYDYANEPKEFRFFEMGDHQFLRPVDQKRGHRTQL